MSDLGWFYAIENREDFDCFLHYQLELVQAPTRSSVLLGDNHDGEPRSPDGSAKLVGDGISDFELPIVFEGSDSPCAKCFVQMADEGFAGVFSSEADEDIVDPSSM